MNNDPIEQWLHQKLDHFQPEAPSDAWQRLEPNLPTKKKRSLFWIGWIGAAMLAFLVITICIATLTKNILQTPLDTKVDVAQLSSETSSKIPNNLYYTRPSESSPTTKKVDSIVFKTINTPLVSSTIKSKEFNLSFLPKSKMVEQKITNSKAPIEIPSIAVPAFSAPERLERESLSQLVFDAPAPTINIYGWSQITADAENSIPIWFGIDAGAAVFIENKLSENLNGLAFPEQALHPGKGTQFGVSVKIEPIKNWRIGLGLQYVQQLHKARHTATLKLRDGVLLNTNDLGLKSYEFQYNLVSSSQRSSLTLRIDEEGPNSHISLDEPFILDMKTSRQSKAWRVPFSVERHFGRGLWQGFLKGGLAFDFAQSSHVEITHFSESCLDLCFSNGLLPQISTQSSTSSSLGWMFGGGLERLLSPSISLRLEPFVVGKKHQSQFGFSLGLLYKY